MQIQTPSIFRRCMQLLFATSTLLVSCSTLAQDNFSVCGSLKNNYGPFDYRTDRGETLDVVNRAHFTPQTEALIRGNTGSIGQDLSYTLRTFPNHHRALMTMMKYAQRLKTEQPTDAEFSIDCYFERALRFRSDDVVVRMMYASFLTTNKRIPQARQELEQVAKIARDNPFTHYNMGMVYLDMKEYEKALAEAHIAMALGLSQTGLRDKLTELGHWRAPEETSSPAQTDPVKP